MNFVKISTRLFSGTSKIIPVASGSNIIRKNVPDDLGKPLYLTKYIENGDIETAQTLSLVNHPDMSVKSHAGYITVNKIYNSNMFFWYFPAKENAKNAPVVLFIAGGPGMSSLTSTFLGNGPYNVTSPNKLIPNENSWHLNHHLIYIDNPVGTGYSSTDSEDGYSKNEIDVGQNLLFALQQFFVLFPNLQKNDFFASGPSYAGKFVPAIGHAIHHDRKRESVDPLKPKINLKGIAIGGGNINPISQIIHTAEFVHQMGLVDSSGQKLIIEQQNLTLNCLKKKDFLTAKHHYDKMCELTPIALMEPNSELMMYRLRATLAFLNEPRTRRAIHVGNNTFHDLRTVKKYLEVDFMTSVVDWLGELLPHYKLMLYSGQLDAYYPYPSLEELISHIKFDGIEEYKTTERQMFRVDNEIAGFTKQVGNYTEVLFLNSGHVVGFDQPKRLLDRILRFTQSQT